MRNGLLSVGLGIILFLIACSNDTGKSKQTSANGEDVQQVGAKARDKVIDGIRIKVEQRHIDEKVKNQKTQLLYTFVISGENVSSVNKGLGSIDFILKTKSGKEVRVDSSMAMFGDEIEPGKRIKGKVSFALDKKQIGTKLVYKPVNKELAEWDVLPK
ncbi:DUF4354 domain-containing protein [Listeria aquatica]|uniref:DUF4354 domain-containing protein n=1 Tax=Listeria aquatica TaxID=1494960 RepID=A0A841ZPU0_9LIST|nr:DUF4354 domain-containing protein [Listeria aquatica]MBC1521344.1 DUF4354 domain-containing protein [Listeria aquatica]